MDRMGDGGGIIARPRWNYLRMVAQRKIGKRAILAAPGSAVLATRPKGKGQAGGRIQRVHFAPRGRGGEEPSALYTSTQYPVYCTSTGSPNSVQDYDG